MSTWSRRWRFVVVAIVPLAGILGFSEWRRQNQAWQPEVLPIVAQKIEPAEPPLDPKELDAKYRDPKQFALLLDDVRRIAAEVSDRERQLEHVEENVFLEIDGDKPPKAGERHTERIWFDGEEKYRQTIEWVDLVKNKPKKGVNLKPRRDTGKIDGFFPFSRPAAEDDYRYEFAGIEPWGESYAVKVTFGPAGKPKGRFKGEAWIDPRGHAPYRLICNVAEKIPFVDQVTTVLEYGPAETDTYQIKRSIIEGSGGFAMLHRHYRSEIDFRDYRWPGGQKNAPAANESP